MRKLPATVITGFLGSGKTTLLSHIIRHSGELRLAVLVNEFGELGIDGELLRCPLPCHENSDERDVPVFELANGCICCTVQEEFFPVMKQLVAMRDRIDHIIIETSGLALPKPLVQAFQWPEIKTHCTVDAVITVVDSPAVHEGLFASNPDAVQKQRLKDDSLDHESSLAELFHDQVHTADMIILNKSDLLNHVQLQAVQEQVQKHMRDGVHMVEAQFGKLAPEMILGLDKNVEEYIDDIHGHHDHHGEDHDHHHDDFQSVILKFEKISRENLQKFCEDLLAHFPILRLKGLIHTGKPMRLVAQGVGRRLEFYYDRPWQPDESCASTLVLIGHELPEAEIRTFSDRYLTAIHASA